MGLADGLKTLFTEGKLTAQPGSLASKVNAPDINLPSLDGLSISDKFGDSIRDLQQQAAAGQQAYQTQSAQTAMQFSADEAQKNRDFQEYMSSTAYQRATEDMRKAGLNPILAVSGGFGGASTPAGSAASGIAQSGAMASVSELNSGLEALSTYLEALVSAGDIADKFLSGKNTNKIGFGD